MFPNGGLNLVIYSKKKLYKRLNEYSKYNNEHTDIKLQYEFNSPELSFLCDKYDFKSFGEKSLLATMSDIMHFVFKSLSISEKKKIIEIKYFSSLTIDDLREKNKERFSCWVYALYLTECFLSLGIQARMIRCFSGLPFDNDCHCVVVAYCDEYKKNVLFDVANNTVYYSYFGEPLSLKEFRDCIITGERIFYIQERRNDKESLINYWVKNLLIFQSYEIQRYGNELGFQYNNTNRVIFLLPHNLNISRKWLASICDYKAVVTRNQDVFWGV